MHFGQSVLAQLVEQLTVNQRVAGSSPADGAMIRAHGFFRGPSFFAPSSIARCQASAFSSKKDPGIAILDYMQGVADRAQQLALLVRRDFLEVIGQASTSFIEIRKIPSGVVGSVVISSQQTGRPARLAKERRWR